MNIQPFIDRLNVRFGEKSGSDGNCGMWVYALRKFLMNVHHVKAEDAVLSYLTECDERENREIIAHVCLSYKGELYDCTGGPHDEAFIIEAFSDLEDETADFLEYIEADEEALDRITAGTTHTRDWREYYDCLMAIAAVGC